jgi:hypothetical protein
MTYLQLCQQLAAEILSVREYSQLEQYDAQMVVSAVNGALEDWFRLAPFPFRREEDVVPVFANVPAISAVLTKGSKTVLELGLGGKNVAGCVVQIGTEYYTLSGPETLTEDFRGESGFYHAITFCTAVYPSKKAVRMMNSPVFATNDGRQAVSLTPFLECEQRVGFSLPSSWRDWGHSWHLWGRIGAHLYSTRYVDGVNDFATSYAGRTLGIFLHWLPQEAGKMKLIYEAAPPATSVQTLVQDGTIPRVVDIETTLKPLARAALFSSPVARDGLDRQKIFLDAEMARRQIALLPAYTEPTTFTLGTPFGF